MNEQKKVFIKTYGCQMNVYDSERIAGALAKTGYEETGEMADADLVLLNTCHIREKAAEKVYSELGRIQHLKTDKPNLKVGVTGCVAQAEGAEIIKRQPLVDLVVGPQAYHRLPSMLGALEDGVSLVDTEFPEDDKFNHLPKQKTNNAIAAFLSVQEGCDKFCAFCVVPYTRGAEVSRPVAAILDEAKYLVDSGIQEITLLGQNVNAYHGLDDTGREISLAELIHRLAKIDGLRRIRFTTSHPNEMDEELISAFASEPKLMPYLHLPIQSGSDKILRAMNRKHNVETYLDIIRRIRAARPDIAISGDFIVGFPGESEEDFANTLALCDEVKYAHAFSFKYSPRPGTPAENLPQIPEDVKAERLQRLQTKLWDLQQDFMTGLIGKTLPILFERKGKYEGQMSGRSPYLFATSANAPATLVGQEGMVKITGYSRNTLTGIYES